MINDGKLNLLLCRSLQAVKVVMKLLIAAFCMACMLARVAAQEIVLFGDSLSDNGNGYAANAKFVLRTTDVSYMTLLTRLCSIQ